ncbi:aldehyde dehydrogenase family protein [Burkholderia metallica]|uniref:aldehyde dehydrogenase family protein n=2 Tax=Burkholderia metallica TaxID=488729 RepID=UPI0009FEA4D3
MHMATGPSSRTATGMPPVAHEPLGRHAGVDRVSFTGWADTGRKRLTYAAESSLKRIVLECRRKNPATATSPRGRTPRTPRSRPSGSTSRRPPM